MGTGPIQDDNNRVPIGKDFWKQKENMGEENNTHWKSPTGEDYIPVGKSYQEVSRNNIQQVVNQQANTVKNILKAGGEIISFALGGWAVSCTTNPSATEAISSETHVNSTIDNN